MSRGAITFSRDHPCTIVSLRASLTAITAVQPTYKETHDIMQWEWHTSDNTICLTYWLTSTLAGEYTVVIGEDNPELRKLILHWRDQWKA